MYKKILALTTIAVLGLSCLSGCGKKKDVEEVTTESYSIDIDSDSMLDGDAEDVSMVKDGKIINDLTGEWTPVEEADDRYYAVMINNIIDAMPQSGIEQADVVYEMLEEGGITRLMGIFQASKNVEKVGPIRSARHYYDRKAMEYDAVFVHWGQSIYAYHEFETLKALDQVDLNGKDGAYGFRASDRVAPHNAYSSSEKIMGAIESNGFPTKKCSSYKRMFKFNLKDTTPEGTPANKVTTAYNSGRMPWFEYDSESGLYKRFQYGTEQIDKETGNQLTYKNVIVQFAPHRNIVNDQVGCIDIDYSGEGTGYYISDGQIVPITWEKKSGKSFINYTTTDGMLDATIRDGEETDYGITKFFTADGEELKLNPGKTWVTVFPDDDKEGIIVE